MGNGKNNPTARQGSTDIYGSLDTRNIGSRYSDVEAITPNVNLTPEGEDKTADVFAPTTPPDAGMSPQERQAKYVEDSHRAENIASVVDGVDPEAKARQDTFGAAETVSKSGPEGVEVTRTSADEHQLDGRFDDGGPGNGPATTVGEQNPGLFTPNDGKDHTLRDGPSMERDHPNDGKSFPGADPAVVTPESLRESGQDDKAERMEDAQDEAKGAPSTEDLPENWRNENKGPLTELAQARGVEIGADDHKADIVTKLEGWQKKQKKGQPQK